MSAGQSEMDKLPMPPTFRILISAGDPSGDLHASRMAGELLRRRADTHLYGLGGPRMAEAGVQTSHDNRGCSTIGIAESLKIIPRLWRTMADMRHWMDTMPPDLVICVDYGAFNLRLAREVRARGIPLLYYIPPGSWAREMRKVTRKVARLSTRVATPFRWSAGLLAEAGANVQFVGHPLLDGLSTMPSEEQARERLGLQPEQQAVALLPGARQAEIRYILPPLLRAARIMVARRPALRPIVSCAPSADRAAIERVIRRERVEAGITDSTPHLLRGASLGITKSGTITMDAALAGLPVVVTYAASKVSLIQYHLLVKRMIRYIAMPNILMDEEIVPERYARRGSPECLAEEALAIYDDAARRSAILAGYDRMRAELGAPGAASAVADMVEEMLAEAARLRGSAEP